MTGDEIGVEFLVRPNDREEDVVGDADGDDELEASRPACALVASRRAVATSRLRDLSAAVFSQYFHFHAKSSPLVCLMLLPAIEQSSGNIVLVPVNIFFARVCKLGGRVMDRRSSWRTGCRGMDRSLSLLSMCEVKDFCVHRCKDLVWGLSKTGFEAWDESERASRFLSSQRDLATES